MPTDLTAVYARKRLVQAQAQADITMALIWIIVWLTNLVLLFADQSFARATIELMTIY